MVHYLTPKYQCPETDESFEGVPHCEKPRCEQYQGHSPQGIIYCASDSDIATDHDTEGDY